MKCGNTYINPRNLVCKTKMEIRSTKRVAYVNVAWGLGV